MVLKYIVPSDVHPDDIPALARLANELNRLEEGEEKLIKRLSIAKEYRAKETQKILEGKLDFIDEQANKKYVEFNEAVKKSREKI